MARARDRTAPASLLPRESAGLAGPARRARTAARAAARCRAVCGGAATPRPRRHRAAADDLGARTPAAPPIARRAGHAERHHAAPLHRVRRACRSGRCDAAHGQNGLLPARGRRPASCPSTLGARRRRHRPAAGLARALARLPGRSLARSRIARAGRAQRTGHARANRPALGRPRAAPRHARAARGHPPLAQPRPAPAARLGFRAAHRARPCEPCSTAPRAPARRCRPA